MRKSKKTKSSSTSTAESVRKQIDTGGERIWRLADFEDMPFTAVAKILSRLCRQGIIQRLGKGLYYRSQQTAFGPSIPSSNHIHNLGIKRKGVFPAGIAAANLLGFTTQNAAKPEIATYRLSLPRLMVGKKTIIHTKRPESWKELSKKDGALLDFLRQGGKTSELPPDETVLKLLKHFREKGQFKRLAQIAESEPPRVRAILGAIGQELRYQKKLITPLKDSLNSLSKFDFGNLIALKYAKEWQAKEKQAHETI